MTDLRTAAQQALERLRKYHHGHGFAADAECIASLEAALAEQRLTEAQQEMERSIESLKAALAQEQKQEQAEPVCKCDLQTRLVGDGCEVCNPALAAELAQEQAEPVQEPVAWSQPRALDWESHQSEKMLKVTRSRQDEYGFTQRLYTSPPKLVPLTDEEIDAATASPRDALLDLIYEYGTTVEGVLERIRKLCRAIQRALEEKNRGR